MVDVVGQIVYTYTTDDQQLPALDEGNPKEKVRPNVVKVVRLVDAVTRLVVRDQERDDFQVIVATHRATVAVLPARPPLPPAAEAPQLGPVAKKLERDQVDLWLSTCEHVWARVLVCMWDSLLLCGVVRGSGVCSLGAPCVRLWLRLCTGSRASRRCLFHWRSNVRALPHASMPQIFADRCRLT